MALCKCYACPKQGKFEIGEYYGWLYAPGRVIKKRHTIFHKKTKLKSVYDNDGTHTFFSPREYSRFFKDIHSDNTSMRIYIDRKKELLLVPEFKNEGYPYPLPLDYFSRLSFPYTEDSIGQEFWKLWEEHKKRPIVSVQEDEQTTPFYKIVTKGKGWNAFASSRWMINVQFMTSENEMRFIYWYKKQGTYFGLDLNDRVIGRVVPMSASCEEIGRTVLAIFEEAEII